MSSASRQSWAANKRISSLQNVDRRARSSSRSSQAGVSFEDGYTFALRVAFLHYLLQPKKKRKEYLTKPKQHQRTHTTGIGDIMKDFMPTGSSSTNLKLPHSFRTLLEKRMEGVLRGTEKMPGYNDPAVKRTFGEAYTAFTAGDFRKAIDKDRKTEPLILIFYTAATKALGRGKAADDHSWKLMVDRHLALFVRLIMSIIRDSGGEQSRADLITRLNTLEKKLLTNDQDLYIDTGGEGEHKTIEVEIPLTYEVKDMPMVQIVARIFGRTLSQVQADIEPHITDWTEDEALKDLKAYQHRLNSNMAGALRRQDFDVDDAFDEWRKAEGPHLSQMMLDIISAKPELARMSTGGFEKPLPLRPPSMYSEDKAYSDLSRMVTSPDSALSLDPAFSMSSLSSDESENIKSTDEASYTFIPPDPRAYYKFVLKHAMSYDQLHPDEGSENEPLSRQSTELLIELSVHWRLPQTTRLIALLEVASQKFLDQELVIEELYGVFDIVKEVPASEQRKTPFIQMYGQPLLEIPRSKWTMQDCSAYAQVLNNLHTALLRDLLEVASRCFEQKAPPVGPVLMFIMNHIQSDDAFSGRPGDIEQVSEHLRSALIEKAGGVYRDFLDQHIPQTQDDWDFSHVVKLGQAVVSLCERIKKRYRKNPEIIGVNPFKVLAENIFPNFEEDAHAIIQRIIEVAKDRGLEVNLQDGFDLYKELVEIRKLHVAALPQKPFAFHIEGVLDEFVWRWIKGAEARMREFVEEAIKQDNFQIRTSDPDRTPTDAERHSVSIIDMFQLFNQTADQVYQLQWDNDVHHARFMTALSKAFAAGIGRYCEVVEQQFAKEMDRPSAHELAAVNQSAQERWMQYAKDAISTKEKVEPFQFLPESFVKLNNIEYAMQALDKLEKVVNVDACADVLARVDGPPKVIDRRNAKYVFTIKIVEAEDLKACDPNGTSDPYVVLVDEYQKRLAKTRIIMRNLNPRWDESVDITVTGALNIIATIWDYDTFGDHDFVGRTSLKLDPVHFSDYLPREFWLDLDTQGRLLLRVSMEGERDDIQFHFGKAFRHLKRTERDMVRKVTDKLVTHINASLSREALRNLLGRSITGSMAALWQKRTSKAPALTQADIENALQSLFTYFDENFAIMKQTLTDATMVAVMTRLWKEVLMAMEKLLVPPMSDKPSTQKPLTQAELDVVYRWLQLLFEFFNAKDEGGEVLGVPADVLKSPKWHELASLNFFYFDSTDNLIRTSERMAAATAQRAQQQLQAASAGGHGSRMSAPASLGAPTPAATAFASMGTIRRGKSIMMSRNLGTMRKAKEEKRREAQADPSDDMILRILRMRPEAAGYLRDRHRQKERMQAHQAAAMIVRQSVMTQGQGQHGGRKRNGGGSGGVPPVPQVPFGGAAYGNGGVPRR